MQAYSLPSEPPGRAFGKVNGMSANEQKFSVLDPLFLGFSSAFLHLQAGGNLASAFSISIFNLDYA